MVLGPRVDTFAALENRFIRNLTLQTGLRPLTSDLAREMIIRPLIEAAAGRFGWPASDRRPAPGLCRRIIELIDLMRQNGFSPEDLARTASPGGDGRIEGLAALWADYLEYLDKNGLTDQPGLRRLILSTLEMGDLPDFLAGIGKIVVKNFSRLTPWQAEMTKALARGFSEVELRLHCPPWIFGLDLPESHPLEDLTRLIRDFEAMGDSRHGLVIDFKSNVRPDAAPELGFLAENLFRADAVESGEISGQGALAVFSAPGRYAEIEEIGRRVRRLLDDGAAPESIGVAAPALGEYGQLVEDVFRRFRLPLYFRRGAPLMIQGPVRALLALLRLAGSKWERDRVLDVMASPYLNLGDRISWDRAAEISARLGVMDDRGGSGWRLLQKPAAGVAAPGEAAALAEAVQNLKEKLRPLTRAQTWDDFRSNCLKLLGDLELPERVLAAPAESLHRDGAALAGLEAVLEELTRAASLAGREAEKVSPEVLAEELTAALQGRNLEDAGSPGSGIMVLNPFDLHGLSFDHIFAAGLGEGEFPQTEAGSPFLGDRDLAELNRAWGKRVFLSASDRRRSEELSFLSIVSAAGKSLTLSYSRSDERGRIRLPSALLDEVLRLGPDLEVEEIPYRAVAPYELILTREELVGRLSRDFLGSGRKRDRSGDELAEKALAVLTDNPDEAARWQSVAARTAGAFEAAGREQNVFDGKIALETAAAWVEGLTRYEGVPLVSPTMLEEYAACPFAFWAHKLLGLEPPPEPSDELDPQEQGSLVHRILSVFMSACRDRGWFPLARADGAEALLESTMIDVFDLAERRGPTGRAALWQARKREMAASLRLWLEKEKEEEGDFIPQYFEWTFGPGETSGPPLEVGLLSGGRLFFKGRVDRIDVSPDRALVLDYKSSGNTPKYKGRLKEEQMGVLSFQAPLYQLAAADFLKKPVNSTFILLGDLSKRNLPPGPETTEDFFQAAPEKRWTASESGRANFFNRLEEVWLRLASGDFTPRPDPGQCDFCEFKTVCRKEDSRDEGV